MALGLLKQAGILIVILVVAVAAFNLGVGSRGPESKPGATRAASPDHEDHDKSEHEGETIWTCPMHPEIRMPNPGKCPICGMDLVEQKIETAKAPQATAARQPKGYACAMNCVPPLPNPGKCPICGMQMQPLFDDVKAGEGSARRLSLSPEARALAGIQTSPVQRQWVEQTIHMVGSVDYDETRLAYITAYIGGRLDRLFVDYTGTTVRAGDHMAEIYSPDLLSAQQELFQARDAWERSKESTVEGLRQTSERALEATRERLRLWGLKPEQIEQIENSRQVADHVTLYSPIGGIVINKMVQVGDYMETGDRIYTIADLTHLWVKLKAYESDLPWLRYGQDIAFTAEALPGEEFHGRVSFINPTLDTMTRTVDVRVNVENSAAKLKPGMFVRAKAKSRLARGGKVIEPELAGKWISPMHPEIIKDGPGSCDVCGMALVPVEELGFVAAVADEPPLVIPASAPLITGRRAVVYVEVPGEDRPTYEGREVTLGPRAGQNYIVIEGLREGERVVTKGAFKIDSSLQIIAKPSMMNPEGGKITTGHEGHGAGAQSAPGASAAPVEGQSDKPKAAMEMPQRLEVLDEFRTRLTPIYDQYFAVQRALAADDFAAAKSASAKLAEAAKSFRHDDQPQQIQSACAMPIAGVAAAADEIRIATAIAAARQTFEKLSDAVIVLEQQLGHAGKQTFRLAFCPMAFNNKGADWLQTAEEIANPYFGAEMPTCGVVTKTFEPAASAATDDHAGHQR